MSSAKRICFVCLGNVVRSPLAEHLFRHLAEEAGVAHKYEVSSRGIDSYHVGEPPDARMRRVAARHGFVYDGRARRVQAKELDHYDLVIAMDNENRQSLLSMARTPELRAKIRMLREFDPQGGPRAIVPDPWYGGADGFEEVYAIVERSVRGLLEALEGQVGESNQGI